MSDPDPVIGIRYEGDLVWIDVCDASGVHSAVAPPELDPRRMAALEGKVQRVHRLCLDHAVNAEKVGQGASAVVSPRLVLAILDAVPAVETTNGKGA